MTFEEWWAKEFSNVNIQWYENSSDALTKEWFNIVKQAFEDGKAATHSEDGRIAELEGLLRTASAELRHPAVIGFEDEIADRIDALLAGQQQAEPCEDMAEQLERAEIRMMFGDAQEPATNSEDGLPMQVTYGGRNPLYEGLFDGETEWQRLERIVAAKDAEIAELKSGVKMLEESCRAQSEELRTRDADIFNLQYDANCASLKIRQLEQLRAQPARQVGDEREAYEREYQAELKRSGGTLYPAVFARNNDKYVIGHVQTGWWAWSHRAALSPVASQVGGDGHKIVCGKVKVVYGHGDYGRCGDPDRIGGGISQCKDCAALAPTAAVMPERRSEDYPSPRTRDAWNAALDEVARLNRRAIPEGLLERIAKMPSSPEAEMDRYEACDELRSLLSQQQEGGV